MISAVMGSRSIEKKTPKWDERIDQIILWLFVGIFAIMPTAFGGTLIWAFSLTECLVAVGLILWGMKLWLDKSHRIFWNPAVWLVLGITGYAFIRSFLPSIHFSAMKELTKVVLYCSVFFLFINNLRRRKSIKFFAMCLIGIALLISFYAIAQFMTGSEKIFWVQQPEIYNHRASGTYICPNHLAGFLEMVLPLALALTISGRLGQIQKIYVGFASVILLGGIAVTISRAGYVSALVALALVLCNLYKLPKYRIPAILATLLVLIGLGWFLMGKSQVQSRFDELLNATQLEEGRGAIFQSSLPMVGEHPLLGMGLGSYDTRMYHYISEKIQNAPLFAHSDYLQFIIEWGIIGFILLLLLLANMIWGVFKTMRYFAQKGSNSSRDSSRAALFLGAAAAMVAIMLHSFVDFNMHVPANALTAVALFALVISCQRFVDESCWLKQTPFVRGVVSVLILIFAGMLVFDAVQSTRVHRLVQMAKNYQGTVEGRDTLYREAMEISPRDWSIALKRANALLDYGYPAETENHRISLERAAGIYEQAIKENPWRYELEAGLGQTLILLGKNEQGMQHAKRALELYPNGSRTHAIYGWCALYSRDYELAVKHLENSIHLRNEGNDFAKNWYKIAQQRLSEIKKYE